MSSLELYLLILIGNLSMFFGIVGFVILMGTGIFVLANSPDDFYECLGEAKKAILVAIGCGFLATVCPSTTEMAAIYIIPKIVNNADMQKLPTELTSLAVEWLRGIKKER